jgi:hypothetical protein
VGEVGGFPSRRQGWNVGYEGHARNEDLQLCVWHKVSHRCEVLLQHLGRLVNRFVEAVTVGKALSLHKRNKKD